MLIYTCTCHYYYQHDLPQLPWLEQPERSLGLVPTIAVYTSIAVIGGYKDISIRDFLDVQVYMLYIYVETLRHILCRIVFKNAGICHVTRSDAHGLLGLLPH